jgi:hypothetical protein
VNGKHGLSVSSGQLANGAGHERSRGFHKKNRLYRLCRLRGKVRGGDKSSRNQKRRRWRRRSSCEAFVVRLFKSFVNTTEFIVCVRMARIAPVTDHALLMLGNVIPVIRSEVIVQPRLSRVRRVRVQSSRRSMGAELVFETRRSTVAARIVCAASCVGAAAGRTVVNDPMRRMR